MKLNNPYDELTITRQRMLEDSPISLGGTKAKIAGKTRATTLPGATKQCNSTDSKYMNGVVIKTAVPLKTFTIDGTIISPPSINRKQQPIDEVFKVEDL